MSVTMTKADGVTMLTLTTDPKSNWPPLCQILGGLCYSPACSVSRRLGSVMGTSQWILGSLQVTVGLLNVGLGAILMSSWNGSSWQMDVTGYPHWLGALFVVFGSVCILSERFPSPCLVLVNVILNFAGIGFAIAGVVLYSINAANVQLWGVCRDDRDSFYGRRSSATLSPARELYSDRCLEGKHLLLMLLWGIYLVAVALCVLEVCLLISSCTLALKSLCQSGRRYDQPPQSADGEPDAKYEPLVNQNVEA
ncbi:uncharacterized protein LOC144072886 [Stigmatopora argus]